MTAGLNMRNKTSMEPLASNKTWETLGCSLVNLVSDNICHSKIIREHAEITFSYSQQHSTASSAFCDHRRLQSYDLTRGEINMCILLLNYYYYYYLFLMP